MKTLIIFDSVYGNTEKIAKVLKKSISGFVMERQVSDVHFSELNSVELLIVGSPTHGGNPSKKMTAFLDTIPKNYLKGIKVAAFDTRFSEKNHGLFLYLLMRLIRFASEKISTKLVSKGGILVSKPEGFIVEGKEGPLREGELERAKAWVKSFK